MHDLKTKITKAFSNGLAVWIIIGLLAITASFTSKDFATISTTILDRLPSLLWAHAGCFLR